MGLELLVTIYLTLFLIWLCAASVVVYLWLKGREVAARESNHHFSEIARNLGGRPFVPMDGEKIESRVVINDKWDEERMPTD